LIRCASWAEWYLYHAEMIAEYMQIFPRYCIGAPAGGGTTLAMMHHAASAIATGVCNTVLIAAADSLVLGSVARPGDRDDVYRRPSVIRTLLRAADSRTLCTYRSRP
jgi:acetyl-CoA acetyltransferase